MSQCTGSSRPRQNARSGASTARSYGGRGSRWVRAKRRKRCRKDGGGNQPGCPKTKPGPRFQREPRLTLDDAMGDVAPSAPPLNGKIESSGPPSQRADELPVASTRAASCLRAGADTDWPAILDGRPPWVEALKL